MEPVFIYLFIYLEWSLELDPHHVIPIEALPNTTAIVSIDTF